MIKEEEQKSLEEMQVFKELYYLKDPVYFRQQLLLLLDKIAVAQERQAEAMEKLSSEEEETPLKGRR